MKNLPHKVRSKKLSSRVDLTAMVSVSFLLIIFFMVVGELKKPKIMDLTLPYYDPKWDNIAFCGAGTEHRLITVLLDDNDQIISYSGFLFDTILKPKKLSYGKNGIQKELLDKKKTISEYGASMGRSNYSPIVIIKPSKKSNFKNLVDILNEMTIAQIDTYAIINDFSPEESKLLASNK